MRSQRFELSTRVPTIRLKRVEQRRLLLPILRALIFPAKPEPPFLHHNHRINAPEVGLVLHKHWGGGAGTLTFTLHFFSQVMREIDCGHTIVCWSLKESYRSAKLFPFGYMCTPNCGNPKPPRRKTRASCGIPLRPEFQRHRGTELWWTPLIQFPYWTRMIRRRSCR